MYVFCLTRYVGTDTAAFPTSLACADTSHVTHQVTIGQIVRVLNVHAKVRHAQVARRCKSHTREARKAGI